MTKVLMCNYNISDIRKSSATNKATKPELSAQRPLIALNCDSEITNNGCYVRVVIRDDRISIGCTDVTVEAIKRILELYHHKKRGVVQP